jgi:hypothetical protein
LASTLKPEEPGNLDRIFAFAKEELSYLPQKTMALPLIVYLLYGQRGSSKQYFAELFKKYQEEISLLKRAARFGSELTNLLPYIIWPSSVAKNFDWSNFICQREVSPNGEGISGCFFSEKLSRNIQYESHLELQFLLKLEHARNIVFYQEQPFVIPYQFDGHARNYYPDLFFALEDGRGVVVEIKPLYQMALYQNLTKWSAVLKFCASKGWGLLVTDGKIPFQKLQKLELSPDFEGTLLKTLANSETGLLSWKEYRNIRDQYDATWIDFVVVILKNRLIWSLQPFVLKQRGS